MQHFGMSKIGKDKFGDKIYELDLMAVRLPSKVLPALKRLQKVYAEHQA